MKMNSLRKSIFGGKSLPRIHTYESTDKDKPYDEIKDCLHFKDISGMYVYIMKKFSFPFNKCKYVSVKDLEMYNKELEAGNYTNLMNNKLFIVEVECQPNECDLEPPIGRYENGKLIWDCARRREVYTYIDLQKLLKSK